MTFETLAPWLAALVVIGTLYGIGTHQRRPGRIRKRSEAHEAYLAFLSDILDQPELRDLMIRQGTGSAAGIETFRDAMGQFSYPFLRASAAKLLGDRIVRRQVARFLEQKRGGDRRKVLREMGGIVEEVRG